MGSFMFGFLFGLVLGFCASMFLKDRLHVSWDADGHKTLDISKMTPEEKSYWTRMDKSKENNGELTGRD